MMDNLNDKVYTPHHIVQEVLTEFGQHITRDSTILEPFKGGGAFYEPLVSNYSKVSWCEIDEGVDFFKHNNAYDWIVTNPPYSIFNKVLPRCLELADNNLLVIPVNKLLSSMPRLMDVKRAGCSIRQLHYLGSGRQLKFPFGFPVACVWIQRGWEGGIKDTYESRCFKAKRKNDGSM
jgi:hypothetical protein